MAVPAIQLDSPTLAENVAAPAIQRESSENIQIHAQAVDNLYHDEKQDDNQQLREIKISGRVKRTQARESSQSQTQLQETSHQFFSANE